MQNDRTNANKTQVSNEYKVCDTFPFSNLTHQIVSTYPTSPKWPTANFEIANTLLCSIKANGRHPRSSSTPESVQISTKSWLFHITDYRSFRLISTINLSSQLETSFKNRYQQYIVYIEMYLSSKSCYVVFC